MPSVRYAVSIVLKGCLATAYERKLHRYGEEHIIERLVHEGINKASVYIQLNDTLGLYKVAKGLLERSADDQADLYSEKVVTISSLLHFRGEYEPRLIHYIQGFMSLNGFSRKETIEFLVKLSLDDIHAIDYVVGERPRIKLTSSRELIRHFDINTDVLQN